MGSLRLTISPDNDGTCLLHAEVSADGFSGIGHAWFDLKRLQSFAMDLEKYPLTSDPRVAIEGGFLSRNHPYKVEQRHLSISVYPVNSRGVLGVQVYVSSPLHEQDRPESQRVAQLELLTHYAELESFSAQIRNMVLQQAGEAVLKSS
jgi:hypothetical protein